MKRYPRALLFLGNLGVLVVLLVALELACAGALALLERHEDPAEDPRERADTYAGAAWVREYFDELRQSAQLRWESYTYFRRRPFQGTHITVDARGLRKTYVPAHPSLKIYFLGGSTAWGLGARDEFTVASCLARQLEKAGVAAEVTNFGEKGWVSTQSLVQLVRELQQGRVPDVVVSYEGLNDVFSALQHAQAGLPKNEAHRAREFNLLNPAQRGRLYLETVLHSHTGQLAYRLAHAGHRFEAKDFPARPDVIEGVVATYLNNWRLARALGAANGFKVYYFWQPTLFNKPLRTPYEREQLAGAAYMEPIFTAAYARMRQAAQPSAGLVDLSGIFADVSEPRYVDWCHTGEVANEALAAALAATILAGRDHPQPALPVERVPPPAAGGPPVLPGDYRLGY